MKKWMFLFLSPFIMLLLLFFFVPLIYMLYSSLQSNGEWSLSHYQSIFTSAYVLQGFANSIWLSTVSAIVALIVAIFVSGSLYHYSEKVRERILVIINLTSNFAGVPLAFAFIILLGNSGLFTLFIKSIGWNWSFNLYSWSGLLLIFIYFQLPLAIMLVYPSFYAVQKHMKDAAMLLGASNGYFWRKIGLPIIWPALAGTITILFANAMGAYASAYALTGSGYNLAAIQIGALLSGDIFAQPELASAIAVILGAIMVVVMFLSEWFSKKMRKDVHL
ncbi:ABC transporter permease subunit [Rummeliibacillus sp. SL167]|uniref:ABC transporter permease n=1 Tax=Rummeliibacillus sp. SL167 TaxID=2579792 RepID=UPI0011B3C15E|nr:ABC transporter permease subunit [Rummeliibacillus sp. SL167]